MPISSITLARLLNISHQDLMRTIESHESELNAIEGKPFTAEMVTYQYFLRDVQAYYLVGLYAQKVKDATILNALSQISQWCNVPF